jgi:hypothetical protein
MPNCEPTPEELKKLLAGRTPVRVYDLDKFLRDRNKAKSKTTKPNKEGK